MKKYLKLIVLAPLLMAFQCDDDLEPQFIFNDYKVNITPGSNFTVNDTIWIKGEVSSKAYDITLNDSIFNETPQVDVFSVLKLITPTELSNCKDALDQFQVIFDKGQFEFFPMCENADIHALPDLNENTTLYVYRVGLKPINTGDFVISLQNGLLQNENRNEFIIDNYPIENHPGQIGFNRCNRVSWRFLNESDKEFYFTVE